MRKSSFRKAENDAISTIKLILEKAGENGVSTAPADYTDGIFIPVAECEAQKFEPITAIRYWNGKLEVFISKKKDTDGQGWQILPEGRWEDYSRANADTWFILDAISENLEYADGYQD